MKRYVVFSGRKPGIYTSRDECKKHVDGFVGAKYKSYITEQEALAAFHQGYPAISTPIQPIEYPQGLFVDASAQGNPGPTEWRGVYQGKEIFRFGPYQGTNNIGEFIALVQGCVLWPGDVYTDSKTAMSWIRKQHAATTFTPTGDLEIFFKWAVENMSKIDTSKIHFRDTHIGENPADFGRK